MKRVSAVVILIFAWFALCAGGETTAVLKPASNPFEDQDIIKMQIAATRDYVWVATSAGLYAYDKTKKSYFILGNSLLNEHYYIPMVTALGETVFASVSTYTSEQQSKDKAAGQGGYRRGPEGYGFLEFNPVRGSFKYYDDVKGSISALTVDGNALWIGTHSQLVKMNRKTGAFKQLYVSEMGMNASVIYPEGKYIWVAMSEGGADGSWVSRVDKETGEEEQFRIDGEAYNDTYCILKEGGVQWFGTGKGLASYDGAKWKMYSKEQGLISFNVLGLESTKDKFWLGMEKGLMSMDKKTGKFNVYEDFNTKIGNEIYYMVSDKDALWISNSKGLYSFPK